MSNPNSEPKFFRYELTQKDSTAAVDHAVHDANRRIFFQARTFHHSMFKIIYRRSRKLSEPCIQLLRHFQLGLSETFAHCQTRAAISFSSATLNDAIDRRLQVSPSQSVEDERNALLDACFHQRKHRVIALDQGTAALQPSYCCILAVPLTPVLSPFREDDRSFNVSGGGCGHGQR